MPNHKTNLAAFTLIELLAVVAIIALLVTILMPSLQSAKSLAKSAVCMSNEKGTVTALSVYMSDMGKAGIMLATYGKPDGRDGINTWMEQLLATKSISSMASIRCPSWNIGRDFSYPPTVTNANYTNYDDDPWISYGLRALNGLASPNQYTTPYLPDNASEYPWGCDSVQITYNNGYYNQYYQIDGYANGVPHLRHMEKLNLFFADGHVETRNYNQLTTYGTTKTYPTYPHYMFCYKAYDEELLPMN